MCTKCKKEKDITEFSVYWHSTFQKYYMRGQCNLCYRSIQKKWKDSHRIKKSQTKICPKCKEEYYLEEYWGLKKNGKLDILTNPNALCYNCRTSHRMRLLARKAQHRRKLGIPPNEKVLDNPNEYSSIEQKENVFKIMLALGFHFNNKLQIWWKEGFRNENGEFLFL